LDQNRKIFQAARQVFDFFAQKKEGINAYLFEIKGYLLLPPMACILLSLNPNEILFLVLYNNNSKTVIPGQSGIFYRNL